LNGNGESVLIRIIECHFDEDEILARWRGVQTLGHPNFLRIDRFGQFLIEADDITAVYAVFERVDANLGQVLERGRLSPAEAAEIGLSAASALETLHSNGFVHEHVEARNLFAVGETVKLRSDCVRETPEGEAGVAARRRDAHDLAVVLMQVLLGTPRLPDMSRVASLPAPFDQIVSKGLSGEWGLGEIQGTLAAFKTARAPKTKPAPEKPPAVLESAHPASPSPMHATEGRRMDGSPKVAAAPAQTGRVQPASSTPPAAAQTSSSEKAQTISSRRAFPGEERTGIDWAQVLRRLREMPLRGVGAAALFVLVALFGWVLLHHAFSHHAGAAASAPPATRVASAPARSTPAPIAASHQPAPAVRPAAHETAHWRVVAFTYNREEQARKKASTLAARHPELRPEAFSARGRAPWLVTVGGPMDRDAAYALARRAPSLGLPRDTYAQNYGGR
jgi:hypothetical protein